MSRLLPLLLGLHFATLPAVALSQSPSNKAQEVRAKKATQIAKAMVECLLNGQTAVATSLSDVPFAWDRKEVIESLVELESRFNAVVESKGDRSVRATKVEVRRDDKAVPKDAAPIDLIIVVAWIGDEAIEVAIKPGDAYRVVGFSD